MKRDEKIGPTAHYTAYVWRRLDLPHSELFATSLGAVLFWSFRLAGEWVALGSRRIPTMQQYLEVRHRLIERELERIGPDRVVEIGAGLSRRGVTWAADRGVDYVEVDLPHMVRAKRARLERAPGRTGLGEKLRLVALDVLDPDLADRLADELRGAARPVVIAEGLLSYFERAEKAVIARAVRRGLEAAGGGTFVCELRSRDSGLALNVAASVVRAAVRVATRGRGGASDFERTEDLRRFFDECGYRSVRDLDHSVLPHLAHLTVPTRIWSATA